MDLTTHVNSNETDRKERKSLIQQSMAAECAQVVSLGDKQKSSNKNVPPPKNLCQPFTLRLVLGVPIIKSENKAFKDLEALFTTYSKSKPIATIESETFWSHIHTGVNSIVKQLEDAVRDSSPSSSNKTDPFAIVLLDFAWLNSPLGHHLAHICSNMCFTSLVAVDPPSTLSRLLNASTRISCVGVRPLMMPHTERLPLLHEFMRMCAALADKELPPDPALAVSAAAANSSMLGSSAALDGGLGGASSAGSQAAPQYVPILPKPAPALLLQQHHAAAGVDIATSPSATGYVISAGGPHGASGLISSSLLVGSSHTPVQKPQMVAKPPVPRPAVRHVPADDWLTYKLDHASLYKCGADISKELENHSLYIHDVADIWALYPRQKQQQQQSHHASSSADLGVSSGGGLRRASKSKASRLPPPPPPKRGRHVPPQRLEDEEEDDLFDEDDDDLGDMEDEDAFEADYDDSYLEGRHHQHHAGGGRSRYSRHTSGASSSGRGVYRRQQQATTPQQSSSYGGLGRRRSRRSPRW